MSTLVLLQRAASAGPQVGLVARPIRAHHGAHGVREILGPLALAKKQGPAVVEDAAHAAIPNRESSGWRADLPRTKA